MDDVEGGTSSVRAMLSVGVRERLQVEGEVQVKVRRRRGSKSSCDAGEELPGGGTSGAHGRAQKLPYHTGVGFPVSARRLVTLRAGVSRDWDC